MVWMLSMLALPSRADTITQNFNEVSSLSELPDGWTLQNNEYSFYTTLNSTSGVDGSVCLSFDAKGYVGSDATYDFAKYITSAKAGTVSIKVRPNGPSKATWKSSFIAIYKMTDNGDGTFSCSEELVKYTPINSIPGYPNDWNSWNEITVDLDEDSYIGICGCDCFFDDYVNEYTAGGGDEPEVITEPFETWPDIPGTNAGESGTLANGWGYINNHYGFAMSVGNFGVDSSKGIKFQYAEEGEPAIITEAKAGTVSIQVKVNNRGEENYAAYYIAFYKMVKNSDGSYSFGDVIMRYSPLNSMPGFTSASNWVTVTADLSEDTLIGISGFGCTIDNYENVAKAVGPDPGPGEEEEWVVASSENFDTVGTGCGDYSLKASGLPSGWYVSGDVATNDWHGGWPSSKGMNGSACLAIQNNNYSSSNPSSASYLITYARAGKISFLLKTISSAYVNSPSAYLGYYKVSGEPDNFTIGEAIEYYERLNLVPSDPAISAEGFAKVEFDVAEDGWIALSFNQCLFDNFENIVKNGGSATTTVTVEEDFDPKGATSGNSSLVTTELPSGWYGFGSLSDAKTYNASWHETAGVDGSACLKIQNGGLEDRIPYLITYAHKGTVSIMIKAASKWYLDDTRAYLNFCKVNGEPGSFTIGDVIAQYPTLKQANADVSADDFVPVEIEIDADGYIAISADQVYLDNFRNTYEQAAAAYTVTGTVTGTDGNPVAGAQVSIAGFDSATTADDGSYSIANVAGSGLVFSVAAEGYDAYSETIAVEGDMVKDVTLKLTESVMVVTASDYNNNITTPVFTLYDGETPVCENVTANDEGKYVFTLYGKLNPDGYTLKAQTKYFEPYESPVKVNDKYTSYPKIIYGQSANSTAYLRENKLTLTVYVSDQDQEDVADATLTFAYPEDSGATYTRYPTNNGDGSYTFTEIRAGVAADKECTVTCSVPEMKPIEPQTVAFDDQNRSLYFTALPYEPTVITGRIVNAAGQPVPDAMVMLFEGLEMAEGYQEAEINPEGFYEFTIERFDCSYMLVAGADNYEEVEPVIFETVEREATYTQDFTLQPVMYTFTATVVDKDSKKIDSASVYVNDEPLERDENGVFNLSVWAGDAQNVDKYVAVASAEGYVSQEFEFDLYMEEEVEHEFVLEPVPVYTIAGQLLDAETKEPIADEFVTLIAKGEEGMEPVANQMTDAEGRFSFTVEDASVTYVLMGSALGYDAIPEDSPIPVPELIPNGTVNVNIELQPTYYTITVNVKDEQGAPLTDATVTLTDAEGAELATENKGDGTYTYAAPEKKMSFGQYTLTVACDGFQPYTDQFEVVMYTYETNVDATIIKNGIASLFAGQQGAVNANGKIYVLGNVRIFSVNGMIIRTINTQEPVEVELEPGIYIVEGRKMIVK